MVFVSFFLLNDIYVICFFENVVFKIVCGFYYFWIYVNIMINFEVNLFVEVRLFYGRVINLIIVLFCFVVYSGNFVVIYFVL